MSDKLNFLHSYIFSQLFHLFLGHNQRRPAWNADFADSLSDWLVVSLPYSGVYCVNAGCGVIRSTEWTVLKWSMWLTLPIHKVSSTKIHFWHQWGESEALCWWTVISSITQLARSPIWDSSLCSDLLCMHTVYVSFLPWLILEKKNLFFVTVLWCAITHVFLHTVNILWILLLKKILRSR